MEVDFNFTKVPDEFSGKNFDEVETEANEEREKQAENMKNNLIILLKKQAETLIDIGKHLYVIKESDMWHYLKYDSFKDFYTNIGMSSSQVSRSLGAYNIMLRFEVPEEHMQEINPRKIDNLISLANQKIEGKEETIINDDNVEEWIHKAMTNSVSDFIKESNEAKGIRTPKDILEEEHGFYAGTYMLVKTDIEIDDCTPMIDKDIPVKIYTDENGNRIVRIF